MITIFSIMVILFIVQTIRIYRMSKANDENFNPIEHGVGNWMVFFFTGLITFTGITILMIKYLP